MTAKQKILIVDDRKENLFALRQVLREVDAEVLEATSGNEALAATLHHDFAVAILDVQMPEMTGYELAEYLRGDKKTEAIPIVFLTAVYGDEQHVFKGYESGGVDYITKPYSPQILLSKIKIFLAMDRDRRELTMHRDHLETLVVARTAQLKERVKELQCTNAFLSLIAEPGKSIDEMLAASIHLIPSGWQYPEITCVKIVFEGKEFASANCRDTAWKQSAEILLAGKAVGRVDISYLEERPARDEGPFVKEERELIVNIARQLGIMIERKRAEEAILKAKEEWERTFEAIGDVATIQDVNHRILRANRKACEVLGLQPDELTGRFCYEVFHGGAQPCEGCPSALASRDLKTHTAELVHEKLGAKTFSVSAAPICGPAGELTGIVYISRDITEMKALEGQLRQAQKMEAIGTLAGGIAHDFNNILSIIFGYNFLARQEKNPEKRQRQLEELQKGAERAKELVGQILTFSRKTEQQKQPLQISLIIKESLKMLRASIPTTIEIKEEIASTGKVLADPTQIHQVIMNLCTNAYHAMRERGGILGVSLKDVTIGPPESGYAELELAPGSYLMLEVSDTGCGIEQKIQEKIFEPYFTTKKAGEGTGLGLAVVHGIVESHHGHITVHSEPGKGTSFHVYLPLTEQEAVALPEKIAPTELRGKGERILFVDDEMQIRFIVDSILPDNGYKTTIFADPLQAWKNFQENPEAFDLVITDMTMPSMTGAELAQKILALRPQIPVILCTGQSDLINREKALAMGICDYLEKPILTESFLVAVKTALGKKGTV